MHHHLICRAPSAHTLATLSCLISLCMPALVSAGEPDKIPSDSAPEDPSHLVLAQRAQRPATQQRKRRPQGTNTDVRKRRPQRPQEEKSGALELFWRVFPPPGAYTMEVGLSVGANYLETSFGGRNPNVLYRGHFGYRPRPRKLPLTLYGIGEFTDYQQSAGPLEYNSRFVTTAVGAGFNYWFGPLRFDIIGEGGLLTRVSTQRDGFSDPRTVWNVQPVVGAVAGGALAIAGRVALSLRAGVRTYDFGPSRVDASVLYGIEWMIDAKPYQYY